MEAEAVEADAIGVEGGRKITASTSLVGNLWLFYSSTACEENLFHA